MDDTPIICCATFTSNVMLDARSAALFVQAAGRFVSHIDMGAGTNNVNAKSIMGVIALRVARGQRIDLRAEGADANEAVAALKFLLEGGL